RAAGLLEARLLTRDGFPGDDRAVVELPEQKTLAVALYSDEPELLRPILEANPHVRAIFHSVAEYSSTRDRGLVILDRFRPPTPPRGRSHRDAAPRRRFPHSHSRIADAGQIDPLALRESARGRASKQGSESGISRRAGGCAG